MATKVTIIDSNSAQYTAAEFARISTELFAEGILNSYGTNDDLAVVQNGAGTMSVDVKPGCVLIDFLKDSVTWKVVGESNALTNLVVASNSSGSNRIDAVVFSVNDEEPNSLKSNVGELSVVTGTGVSALSDAAISIELGSTNWYRLANVTVANGATQILTANIANTRLSAIIGNYTGGYSQRFKGYFDGTHVGNGNALTGLVHSPVDDHIIPNANEAFDLGSAVNRFRNIYGSGEYLTNVPGGSSINDTYVAGETISAGDAVYLAKKISTPFDKTLSEDGNSYGRLQGFTYIGQTIRTERYQKTLGGFKLRMRTGGSPTGNFIVSMFACGADHKPTGSAIATKTMLWSAVPIVTDQWFHSWLEFSSPVAVDELTEYALVFQLPSGTTVNYFDIWYTSKRQYGEGYMLQSSDAGANYTTSNNSVDIQVKGTKEYGSGTANKVYRSTAYFPSEQCYSFIGIATETKNLDENIIVKKYGSFDFLSASTLAVSQEYFSASPDVVSVGADDTIRGVGQSFTGDGTAIEAIELQLRRLNTIVGDLYIRIYAHSGTYGTSSVPTGAVLAESEPITYNSLSSSAQVGVRFRFKNPFQTVNGVRYVMTIEYWGSLDSSARRIMVTTNASGGTATGNYCSLNSSNVWSAVAARDLFYKIYRRTTSNFTPGSDVYLSDLEGGLSNTPGTNRIIVGKAMTTQKVDLSTSIVLARMGSFIFTGTTSPTTIEIVLGFRPTSIDIASTRVGASVNFSNGFVDDTGAQGSVYDGAYAGVASVAIYNRSGAGVELAGNVTLLDYGFRIVFTYWSTESVNVAYKINAILK